MFLKKEYKIDSLEQRRLQFRDKNMIAIDKWEMYCDGLGSNVGVSSCELNGVSIEYCQVPYEDEFKDDYPWCTCCLNFTNKSIPTINISRCEYIEVVYESSSDVLVYLKDKESFDNRDFYYFKLNASNKLKTEKIFIDNLECPLNKNKDKLNLKKIFSLIFMPQFNYNEGGKTSIRINELKFDGYCLYVNDVFKYVLEDNVGVLLKFYLKVIAYNLKLSKEGLRRVVPSFLQKYIWEYEFRRGHWDYLEFGTRYSIIDLIEDQLNNGNVLDLGCGPGHTIRLLEKFSTYTGIDISKTAIDTAKKKNKQKEHCRFICKDFFEFNSNNKYDAILLLEAVYYFNPKKCNQLLKKYKKMLSKNGRFVIQIYDICLFNDTYVSIKKTWNVIEEYKFSDLNGYEQNPYGVLLVLN